MSTFVKTASIYVDEVASPVEATAAVRRLNELLDDPAIQIVLPEPVNDWEQVSD